MKRMLLLTLCLTGCFFHVENERSQVDATGTYSQTVSKKETGDCDEVYADKNISDPLTVTVTRATDYGADRYKLDFSGYGRECITPIDRDGQLDDACDVDTPFGAAASLQLSFVFTPEGYVGLWTLSIQHRWDEHGRERRACTYAARVNGYRRGLAVVYR